MEKVDIRKAVMEDFDDIFMLLKQLWPDKEVSRKKLMTVFEEGIKSDDDEYFCAEINGKVMGFCSLFMRRSLWQEAYLGYIPELVVDQSARGKGIGAELLRAATDTAQKRGCKVVELDSAFHRKESHALYEKMGFEKKAYHFLKQL